jgi:hypothetical protein
MDLGVRREAGDLHVDAIRAGPRGLEDCFEMASFGHWYTKPTR